MDLSREILSQIVVYSKYARYNTELKRRETWKEIIDRNKAMHIKKYPHLEKEIEKAYKFVYAKKALPSMRSLQFAGKPIEISPNRQYNCAYAPADDWHIFSEAMFLLLGGTGLGYSVQRHHVDKLPEIRKPLDRNRRHLIADSIEGWADAIKILMKSYFFGLSSPVFDYSDIRAKGEILKTSGGRAPGPQPLKDCVHNIVKILDAKETGSKLTPLEVHDILCYIGESVLSGGIRRAACAAMFSMDDEEMLTCKYGNWWEKNPQRRCANNSAVILRHRIKRKEFFDLFKKIKLSGCGEPSFVFTNNKETGFNPSLRKGTKVLTTDGIFPIEELDGKTFHVKNLKGKISKATCRLSGCGENLIKIKLTGGHEYYATKEHEWPVCHGEKNIKTKTQDLKEGDKLPIVREDFLFEGTLGTYEEGFYIGWHLGDGWLTIRGDNGKQQHGLIVSRKDNESQIEDKLKKVLKENNCYANFSDRGSSSELNTVNKFLDVLLERFGARHKSFGLPTKIWTECSEEFRKGLIDALVSSDGTIDQSGKRVSFTSAHESLARDYSDMLGFYGVRTNIVKIKTFLNGKQFTRYEVRTSDLASVFHFRKIFKLSVEHKQKKLDKISTLKSLDREYIKIKSVENTEIYEDVWDVSVYDDTHCFQLAHCITGNCFEASLDPMTFCNLVEINAADIQSQRELNERTAAATLIATLQSGYTDFHYLRDDWKKNTERDALIGVSMTGIASGEILKYNLTEAAELAVQTNIDTAKLIGINPAKRVTCLKPAGSSSLVLGCSSGIGAYWSAYYLRRMKMNKEEPIYKYLSVKFPDLIEDSFEKPQQDAILTIPVKAPRGAITRESENSMDLLERIKKFNIEWIKPGHIHGDNSHNVSATIHIKDDEWDDIGKWMWDSREFYSGLSVFPYSDVDLPQLPFEPCSRYIYEKLFECLKKIDLTKVDEEEDNTELAGELSCAGGQCEIL